MSQARPMQPSVREFAYLRQTGNVANGPAAFFVAQRRRATKKDRRMLRFLPGAAR